MGICLDIGSPMQLRGQTLHRHAAATWAGPGRELHSVWPLTALWALLAWPAGANTNLTAETVTRGLTGDQGHGCSKHGDGKVPEVNSIIFMSCAVHFLIMHVDLFLALFLDRVHRMK